MSSRANLVLLTGRRICEDFQPSRLAIEVPVRRHIAHRVAVTDIFGDLLANWNQLLGLVTWKERLTSGDPRQLLKETRISVPII